MDLGSLICIPKSPRCTMCPLLTICDVGGTTRAKQYPIKLPKKEKEDDSDNQEEFKSSRKGNRKQLGGNS